MTNRRLSSWPFLVVTSLECFDLISAQEKHMSDVLVDVEMLIKSAN